MHPVLCGGFAQGCGAAQRTARAPQLLRCPRAVLETRVRSAKVRRFLLASLLIQPRSLTPHRPQSVFPSRSSLFSRVLRCFSVAWGGRGARGRPLGEKGFRESAPRAPRPPFVRGSGIRRRAQGGAPHHRARTAERRGNEVAGRPRTHPTTQRQTRPAGDRTLPGRASRIGLPGWVQEKGSTRPGMAEDIQCGQPPHLHVCRNARRAPSPPRLQGVATTPPARPSRGRTCPRSHLG